MLQAKQDAQEQRQRMEWLSFRGPRVLYDVEEKDSPVVETEGFVDNKMSRNIASLINTIMDIEVDTRKGDITCVGVQKVNENHPKSLLVKISVQKSARWNLGATEARKKERTYHRRVAD